MPGSRAPRAAVAGERGEWTFHLSGGRLCLDLANTVSWRASREPIERLARYADLLAWSRQAGVLTEAECRRLAAVAARRPGRGARVLEDARALRETIYRIFTRIADKGAPATADVAQLNGWLSAALGRLRVVPERERFTFDWVAEADALERMLWPAARSAAELLVSNELAYVRTCAADTCGWVFLDTTRNRTRRWCDMKVCGNRAKVRRHYHRRKADRAPAARSGHRQAPSPR
jgi:predicted RNA-binding Zn ribbon-like protein